MSRRKLAPIGQGFPSSEEIRSNPIPKIANKKGGKVVTVLSLDLSSRCVGWALGMDGEVVLYGKYVFKSTSQVLGEKLSAFGQYLAVLLDVYAPDRVLVEKPLLRKGNTTARHYEMLGVVRSILWERNRRELLDSWLIPATTVKRLLNVPRGQNHEQNKQLMVRKINQLMQVNLKFDPNSKYKSDDDMADAIALLYAYWRKGRANEL